MDYFQIYGDFLKQSFKLKKPMKIVADSSNGPAGQVIKKLQGAVPDLELISINDNLDGDFSAHGPNPLNAGATDDLVKAVLENKADFGVVFDADADRAFFVDNKGDVLPSFMTSLLLFKNNQPPYVADELVYKALQHVKGIDIHLILRSPVGSRFVKELLKENDAGAGGEFSGHFYFKDFFGVDSGIFAMIEVANSLSTIEHPLSDFLESLPPHKMVNEEMKLGDKKWEDIKPKILEFAQSKGGQIETYEGITLDMGTYWINMRTSNTEPIVRFIGGGTSSEEILSVIEEIKKLV